MSDEPILPKAIERTAKPAPPVAPIAKRAPPVAPIAKRAPPVAPKAKPPSPEITEVRLTSKAKPRSVTPKARPTMMASPPTARPTSLRPSSHAAEHPGATPARASSEPPPPIASTSASSSSRENPAIATASSEEIPAKLTTAASRRKRRKMIAASMQAGERTASSDRTDEDREAYIASALRIGGYAGQLADESRRAGTGILGVSWPLQPKDYSGSAYTDLVSAGRSKNITVLIRPRGDAGYLTLKFNEDNEQQMAEIFWHCLTATQAFVPEDAFDSLELPERWKTSLHQHAPTPLRLRLESRDTLVAVVNIRANLEQLTRETVGEAVRLSEARPFNRRTMMPILAECIRDVLASGETLVRQFPRAALGEPIGLRRLLSARMRREIEPASSFRNSYECCKTFGEYLRACLSYKKKFTFYTAGFQSLQFEFPSERLGHLARGDDRAKQQCKDFIERTYDVDIMWMVDCIPLTSKREHRPQGHLGIHPRNLASFLSLANEAWRLRQYVKFWIRMQCSMMVEEYEGDESVNALYLCRQGKHRSFGWSMIEATLMEYFGFRVHHCNVCAWTQAKERCQRNYPRGCDKCGNVMQNSFNLDTEQRNLLQAAADEFFEVMLAMESMVDPVSVYPWDEA